VKKTINRNSHRRDRRSSAHRRLQRITEAAFRQERRNRDDGMNMMDWAKMIGITPAELTRSGMCV
jgi:hypothetical protein